MNGDFFISSASDYRFTVNHLEQICMMRDCFRATTERWWHDTSSCWHTLRVQ